MTSAALVGFSCTWIPWGRLLTASDLLFLLLLCAVACSPSSFRTLSVAIVSGVGVRSGRALQLGRLSVCQQTSRKERFSLLHVHYVNEHISIYLLRDYAASPILHDSRAVDAWSTAPVSGPPAHPVSIAS